MTLEEGCGNPITISWFSPYFKLPSLLAYQSPYTLHNTHGFWSFNQQAPKLQSNQNKIWTTKWLNLHRVSNT